MPIDFSTVVGPWTSVPGSFPAGFSFMNHAAALLNNGKALIAGGSGSPAAGTAGGTSGTTATQLYDPATDTWTATGSLSFVRTGDPTATLLKDGKVLLVGAGSQPSARPGFPPTTNVQTAELYDPGPGTWSQTATMNAIRTEQTATLLNDGRVLVVGGIQPAAGTTAEIYDPVAKTWTPTGSLSVARGNHTATLLPNGNVLVAGGTGDAAGTTAELYDPGPGTWSPTGNLNVARASHTATFLNNGTVLVAGGEGSPAASPPIGMSANPGNTAEIYDPIAKTWTRTAFQLSTTHVHHTATLLSNGNVLVAGGGIRGQETAVAELYLTKNGRWVSASSMTVPRGNHTATLLMDNRVLVVGGTGTGSGATSYKSLDLAAGFTDECYLDAGAELGRMLQTVRWGYVRPDGTLQAGSGNFTVNKAATGVYDILFTPPFTSIPLVQATQIYNQNVTFLGGDTRDNTVIVGITTQRCRMKTGDSNGLPSDRAFSFMAHAINAVPVPLRPVTLAQVSVADAKNAIGVDAANNVYQFISSDGANWMQIPITSKQMKLVSMASDSTVCGLDPNGAIWQYSITNNAWTQMAGGPVAFRSVSCGSANSIGAMGTDNNCYQNTGSGWTKMASAGYGPMGSGTLVSVASDGTIVANDANGLLYQYNATSSNWQVMDAGWGFTQCSCGSATNISGVDMSGTFWKFTAGPGGGRTQVVPGSTGKQISVAFDGTAWSIGTDNLVYRLVSNAWAPLLV